MYFKTLCNPKCCIKHACEIAREYIKTIHVQIGEHYGKVAVISDENRVLLAHNTANTPAIGIIPPLVHAIAQVFRVFLIEKNKHFFVLMECRIIDDKSIVVFTNGHMLKTISK